MQAIGFDFSMHNPVLVYSFLADAVMDLLMLAFVHSRVRRAVTGPNTLRIEGDTVECRPGVAGKAQELISKVATRVLGRMARVRSKMRSQNIVRATKSLRPAGIARSCGLQEGKLEVLLGITSEF